MARNPTSSQRPKGARAPGKGPKGRSAKLAAAKAAQRREERRTSLLFVGGTALVIVVIAAAVTTAILLGRTSTSSDSLPQPQAAAGTGLPPWKVPADPTDGIKRAGLDASAAEGAANHFHSHLDIFVDGKAVGVPADIGINTSTGSLSELHTHDASGELHIESHSPNKRYVLGQLFDEWNVKLDATNLGGLTVDGTKTLTAYVDGKKVSGDPAEIELLPHREIALVYGSPDQKVDVPSTYDFPAGE